MLERLRADGRRDGVELVPETVEPAEFRRLVEHALETRAEQDRDLGLDELGDVMRSEEPDEVPYPCWPPCCGPG